MKIKEESDKIDLKAKLLSQKQALQREKSDTSHMQHHLTTAWENFNEKKISSKELLEILGKLNRKHCKKEWREIEQSEAAIVESD